MGAVDSIASDRLFRSQFLELPTCAFNFKTRWQVVLGIKARINLNFCMEWLSASRPCVPSSRFASELAFLCASPEQSGVGCFFLMRSAHQASIWPIASGALPEVQRLTHNKESSV